MYAFTSDEKQLFFLDAFGLTRLERPRSVKTDRSLSGGGASLVTIDGRDVHALVYDDAWQRLYPVDVASGKVEKRYSRFELEGALLHPDGQHLIRPEGSALEVYGLDGTSLTRTDLATQDTPEVERIRIGDGPAYEQPVVERDLVLGGSTFALHCDGTIRYGFLGDAATTPEAAIAVPVETPHGFQLSMHPGPGRLLVLVHDPAGAVAHAIVVSGDEGVRRFEIPTIVSPAAAGDRIAGQPDRETVAVFDLNGAEIARHAVTEVKPPKPKKGEAPVVLDHRGLGRIFLGPKSLLYLPEHAESILDLDAGVEIPRKLPAKDREVRRWFTSRLAPRREVGRRFGVRLDVARFMVRKDQSLDIWMQFVGGDSMAASFLYAGTTRAYYDPAMTPPEPYRDGGTGTSSHHQEDPERVDASSLADGFAVLDELGMSIGVVAGGLAEMYEQDHIAADADPLVIWAILDLVSSNGTPGPLVPRVEKWRSRSPTIDDALAGLAAYAASDEALVSIETTKLIGAAMTRFFGADVVRLWVSIYLEQSWPGCGTRYYDLEPFVFAASDAHPEAKQTLQAWIDAHPTTDDEDKRYYVERLADHLRNH